MRNLYSLKRYCLAVTRCNSLIGNWLSSTLSLQFLKSPTLISQGGTFHLMNLHDALGRALSSDSSKAIGVIAQLDSTQLDKTVAR